MRVEDSSEKETHWVARVEMAAESLPVEYKYVLKHRETLEVLSWEAIPGNRTVSAVQGVNVARYAFCPASLALLPCMRV